MEFEHREGAPFGIFATFERVKYPARGRDGGKPGANGRLSLASGQELKGKVSRPFRPASAWSSRCPGGGGYGDAAKRDPRGRRTRHQLGLVSNEAAKADLRRRGRLIHRSAPLLWRSSFPRRHWSRRSQ